MREYYVVSSEILPEVLEKVLAAQKLLATGQVRRISEAVKQVGISRGTFYKYKDTVFAFNQDSSSRKAILNLVIRDEKGALAAVVGTLTEHKANILSLNQTIPINNIASLTVTLDMKDLALPVEELVNHLNGLSHVDKAELVAVE